MKIIDELLRFSQTLLTLNPPVDPKRVGEFEDKLGFKLPNDYKEFLQNYDGVDLSGTTVYGAGKNKSFESLEEVYVFEHHEVGNAMPFYLVPFSPDGGGNHYCFDSRFCTDFSCIVVFWQHDYQYTEADPPEKVYDSFTDWFKDVLIGWTLEDYNYDGTEK